MREQQAKRQQRSASAAHGRQLVLLTPSLADSRHNTLSGGIGAADDEGAETTGGGRWAVFLCCCRERAPMV